jgi:streptomycin 6-kinase
MTFERGNMEMNLPPEFVSNIRNVFKNRGDVFLAALPDLITQASAKWGLTNVEPVPTLSYNFVAFADRGEKSVVLKMGVPNRELLSEIEALRLFNGEGACQLIDVDEQHYWMLLERLTPGEMLVNLKDDEEATRIAAEVMKEIWKPLDDVRDPPRHLHSGRVSPALRITDRTKFIPLSDWFDGLKRWRPMFDGGTGPLSEKIVQRVERWVSAAFAENHHPVLMHGDFHHYNVLSSERGWLVIDPKGVMGPASYEVGPFLMNPWGELLSGTDYRQITKRRIDILHEHLGFERERILEWGLAHAVLSAWWGNEDHINDEYSIGFAEMIAELDIR